MGSCPNTTHYYLQGRCEQDEEVKCALCDPPCNLNLYVEVQPCGSASGGKNRVCVPKTLCLEASCPAGFFESAPCTDPTGPKMCSPCSASCKPGEYIKDQCSSTRDLVCAPCTSDCVSAPGVNGRVGNCSSGKDVQDAVQCVFSSSIVGQSCAQDEWLVKTLTPAFPVLFMDDASILDSAGSPLDMMHPFRSDISADGSKMVVLGQMESLQPGRRQTVIKVFSTTTGNVLKYVYPRNAFFNWLDVSGSQRGGINASIYPTASLLEWDAIDVMFSSDASSIYIVFNCTYDFVGKCSLSLSSSSSSSAEQVSSSDCTALGQGGVLLQKQRGSSSALYKGCVRTAAQKMACLYDTFSSFGVASASSSPAHQIVVFDERAGTSSLLLWNSNETVLTTTTRLRPRSPPAWNSRNSTLYFVVSDPWISSEYGLRYVSMDTQMSSGYLIKVQESLVLDFHSLAFYNNMVVLASDRWRVVTFAPLAAVPSSGVTMTPTELEQVASKGSFKDMAVLGGNKLLLLSHAARSWMMYTHCAPCPANSFTPSGAVGVAGINACKCKADFFGVLRRPVVDICTRCRNGATNLLLNDCPRGMYKTNVPCASDSPMDTTCAPCRSYCMAGTSGGIPGQYISSMCDGKGTSPEVQCANCTKQCPDDDQYMDPFVVCSGLDTFDTRAGQACKPCRKECPLSTYIAGRCLRQNLPDRDSTYCVSCRACNAGEFL